MAEFIIEFILEIIMEGSMSICENKKISKWIRYPVIAIVILVGLSIIGFVIFLSVSVMANSIMGGLLILGIGLLLLGYMIHEIVNMYKGKKREIALKNENKKTIKEDSDLPPSNDFFYYNDYNDKI